MAGLGLFDQNNATAATTPIVTASKFCISISISISYYSAGIFPACH
jgi:hypothetical protein